MHFMWSAVLFDWQRFTDKNHCKFMFTELKSLYCHCEYRPIDLRFLSPLLKVNSHSFFLLSSYLFSIKCSECPASQQNYYKMAVEYKMFFFSVSKKALLDMLVHLKQEHSESANSAKAKIWSRIRIRINSDPDICRIPPKMYWIHSLVGVSYFAK